MRDVVVRGSGWKEVWLEGRGLRGSGCEGRGCEGCLLTTGKRENVLRAL